MTMHLIVQGGKANTKLPKVMQAALTLFVQKGIDRTTIKDIAKAANVAEGALYRHYKSKEDLAWDLFQTHLSQFTNELMAKVLSERTSRDRVRKFVEESFTAFEENTELFIYLILREHTELKKYSAAHQRHPGHVVLQVIEDGQKLGEIRKGEPYVLASIFVGAVIRICVVKMYGNITTDLRTLSEEVAASLWKTLEV
jgi:AcrR family transcriptional regulator